MNIYDLLGLDYGASVEQIEKKMKSYENMLKDEYYRQSYNPEFIALINSEYEKCMKDKISYDRKNQINKNVYNLDDYRNSKNNEDEIIDSVKPIKYKVSRIDSKNNKQAKKLKRNGLVLVAIAGVTVLVSMALIANEINTNKHDSKPVYTTIESKEEYPFDYVVQANDTVFGLKEKYDATRFNYGKQLDMGEEITIYTDDQAIAERQQAVYDEIKEKEKPVSFESYTIKPGDNLPDIAKEYGVTCSQIMEYNENIPDIRTIYAGDTIRIPVYENVKTK